jgi:molecular chaperone Hsp33
LAGWIGEALAAVALLGANLKFEGRISLQLRTPGALRLLVADCTHDGALRGIARRDPDRPLPAEFQSAVADGVLTVTLERECEREPYQGLVPLGGSSLAADLEGYYAQSEQLDTRIHLVAADGRAAGMLLQRMPPEYPGRHAADDDWQRACALIDTLAPIELLEQAPLTLLAQVFAEDEVRVYPAQSLRFSCPCSRERVERMLRLLGAEECLAALAPSGRLEVGCEFCGRRYPFDRVDVERLFHPGASPGSPTVQ